MNYVWDSIPDAQNLLILMNILNFEIQRLKMLSLEMNGETHLTIISNLT